MNEQVRNLSYELRLFGIHKNYEARAQEALAKGLHPSEFLYLLLQDESNQRRDRLAKSLLTRAKFRTQVDLEDWDATFERGISKQKLKDLSTLGFFNSKENLLIVGKTGAGKTHLAVSLGRRLCGNSHSVVFLPMNLFFEEVTAYRTAGKLLGYLRRLNETKALIFDDFGLRNYTHEEANILVDLLEARTKKGPVIITSQVDPKGWIKLFEDPVIAEAIVDRIRHPSQVICLTGGSYREKLSGLNAKLQ
jgi:DNA replication protein DnaC